MITLVCGFGRCGSSLVMRMLHRGGIPICGDLVSGEDDRVQQLPKHWQWMREMDGKALKILDPLDRMPPRSLDIGHQYRVIWTRRTPAEQAKSQIKFLQTVFGKSIRGDNDAIARIARSLIEEEPRNLEYCEKLSEGRMLTVQFEDLIRGLGVEIKRISQFCGGLNEKAMIEDIVQRETGVKCLPYMLELKQLEAT